MEQKAAIPLIALVGPTASGKTALGVTIAKQYNGEVVSADSMQIYKGMQIATAKPTEREMQGIAHHMMGFLEPRQTYSVAQYADRARTVIQEIYARGKTPVLVGGTGLYISTLLNHVTFAAQSDNPALRRRLLDRLEQEGADVLLKELAVFDPDSANRLAFMKNGKRIIRAIEIYQTTGITMTRHLEQSRSTPSPYRDVRIGLTCKNRETLYGKINKRVDQMLTDGLLQEAKSVLSAPCGQTAKMAIGYKELKPYFDGLCTLEEAVEKLKRETRRYSKRQLTWFARDEKIHWIQTDVYEKHEDIEKAACFIIEQSGILK